jgi:Cys-tRNA(Pro)/Cys-tRNA(Cys) deacylase
MAAISKTNVARLLERAKIGYELIPYEFDENDLSAPHVAKALNEPIEITKAHTADIT